MFRIDIAVQQPLPVFPSSCKDTPNTIYIVYKQHHITYLHKNITAMQQESHDVYMYTMALNGK